MLLLACRGSRTNRSRLTKSRTLSQWAIAPLQLLDRLALELEVGAQDLLDRLADPQPAEHLEIGQAFEEQDALGERVGMLHLVDQFVPLELGEPLDAPIVEHPVVQPILVDRGQLVLQRLVESWITCSSPFIAGLRVSLTRAS